MKKAIFSTLFVALFLLHGCTEKKNGDNKQPDTNADAQSGTGDQTGVGDTGTEKDAAASDTGVGIANPASVACVDAGGTLELRNSTEGQFGVCTFTGGAKCEEWALFRDECSADAPNFCETVSDCACGKNTTTNDCFVGQKEFVDTAQQCPDFCTGIAGNLVLKCVDYKCSVGM